MRKVLPVAIVMFFLSAVSVSPARAAVLTFDDLDELTAVDSSYAEVTFTNALVLTAGSNLNELDFPPVSGSNVVTDDGGPISILFAAPVLGFGGYFTYLVPLTLSIFDGAANLLTTLTTAHLENYASSGNPPNEFLQVFAGVGIGRVVIEGDPWGGSFTLDDVTITEFQAVPEPSSLLLLVVGGAIAARRIRPRR